MLNNEQYCKVFLKTYTKPALLACLTWMTNILVAHQKKLLTPGK